MKVFVDDIREPSNPSWIIARSAVAAIQLLKTNMVDVISLDHDLGESSVATGYDVAKWIEAAFMTTGFEPPRILVHTQNPVGREKIKAVIKRLEKADQ